MVKVYSSGSDNGLFYIAMELVDKGSLDDLMALQKRVTEPQVLEVGIQIAQGLRAAFQRGLIHRDVKPGNILFAAGAPLQDRRFRSRGADRQRGRGGGRSLGHAVLRGAGEARTAAAWRIFAAISIRSARRFSTPSPAGRRTRREDASMVALKHLKSQPVSLQSFAPHVSSSTAYVINRTLARGCRTSATPATTKLIQHLEYARNELLTRTAVPCGRVPKTRMVLEDPGQQRAMSFMTLFMLLALGAGGYYLYKYRADIFPAPEKRGVNSTVEARKAAGRSGPATRRRGRN